MIDPDDLTPPPTSFRRSSFPWARALVLLLAAGAAAVGAWLFWFRDQEEPAAGLEDAALDAGQAHADAAEASGPDTLPAVDESDKFVREQAYGAASAADFQKWLETPGLIRRLVAAVSSAADGETPRSALSFIAPVGEVKIVEHGKAAFLAPETFARYEPLARVVASVDPAAAATTLRTIEPICTLAWREIAPGSTRFRESLGTALSRIADAPLPEGELRVVPKGAVWAFADPALESRTALEKQLIRMGPENARKVQEKARELRAALFGAGDAGSAGSNEAGDAASDAG